MNDHIQVGDWVTINTCGPYKVVNRVAFADGKKTRSICVVTPSDGEVNWLRPEWCVKVPPPWRPQPNSLWQNSNGELYQVTVDGERAYPLTQNLPYVAVAELGLRSDSMTELVPKKEKEK